MKIFILLFILTISVYGLEKEKMVTLKSSISGKNYDLKIDKMKIDVKILGNIAETTLDITFLNKLNKTIEGTLYLPMKEGASIFRYEFEMNKKMNKGVVVEKEKARVAYESTVRQKVDPALLVWTKGNNFKTRIYPIEARGTKRIIISYQEELKPELKDCGRKCPDSIYSFPLSLGYKLSSFKLNISASGKKVIPMMKNKNRFVSDKTGNLYLIDENYKPNENIRLGLFSLIKSKNIKSVDTSFNEKRKNWYFYANVIPEKVIETKKKPNKICLYWDNSTSMENRNLEKEIKLITEYKNYLGDNIDISFIPFSNDYTRPLVKVDRASFLTLENIVNKMKTTIYDGGTQLGILDTSKTPNNCTEALIFTDGVSNFGKELPNLTIPTYFINSKLTAEHKLMTFLSNKTGASYINLQNTTIKEALGRLENSEFSFISAEFNKNEVKEVFPNTPTVIKDSFTITGIMKKEVTNIKLNFGIAGKILKSINLPITANKDINKLVERRFAKNKLDELFKLKEQNRSEIISVSKKFSVLTEFTSFLVLEGLNDYLKYSIVPPKELQKEYFKILESRKTAKKRTQMQHIDKVLRKYQELENWWKQDHKRVKRKLKHKKKMLSRGEREVRRARTRRLVETTGMMAKEESATVEKSEMDDDVSNKSLESKDVAKTFSATIELKAFDPNTPYLKKLKSLKDGYYTEYLKLKKDYKKSSSFYLDVSDFFFKKGDKYSALKILSNIAELELDNHELLRMLAYRLWQIKENQLALYTLNVVLKMRPEEPQSYRDIALTYRNMKKYQKAVNFLYQVVSRSWDGRFSDIDLISLYEMNSIIGRVGSENFDLTKIDKRLIKNLPADIRVVLSWDANNTDIDLWVTDPYGERCFYSHKRTQIGGYNSNDFTGGYGPEMFFIRNAHKGKYQIQADYYGSSSQKLSGEITIHAELFLNYGRKNQTKKDIVVRVKSKKQIVDLGTFTVDPKELKNAQNKEIAQNNKKIDLKNRSKKVLNTNKKLDNKKLDTKDLNNTKSNNTKSNNENSNGGCSYNNYSNNFSIFLGLLFLVVLIRRKKSC